MKTYIAIPGFGASGDAGGVSPQSIPDVVYNDWEFFSDFTRVANQQFVDQTQQRDATSGQVDFAEWQRLNANFVLKGSFSVSGGMIRAEVMLHNVDKQQRVFGLIYTDFPANNPRKLAHRISDDIVKNVFNAVGISDTKIAFISARTRPH